MDNAEGTEVTGPKLACGRVAVYAVVREVSAV